VSKGNVTKAREIYTKGVRMNCTDSTSVYHGYAKLELKGGNVEVSERSGGGVEEDEYTRTLNKLTLFSILWLARRSWRSKS